jgi:hypothetical protein
LSFADNASIRDTLEPAYIKAMKSARGDSVVLRWAPTSPPAWRIANNIGYIIERAEYDDSHNIGEYKKLNDIPIKPVAQNEWKNLNIKDDKYCAIAIQCLYGQKYINSVESSQSDQYLERLRLGAMEFENRYGFAMFAADMSVNAANISGLRFVDKNVKEGRLYLYRIFLAEQDSILTIHDATITARAGEDSAWSDSPKELSVLGANQKIKLSWHSYIDDGMEAYNIYRSDDDGETFNKVNSSAILPMLSEQKNVDLNYIPAEYNDTINIINGKEYIYCVKGINAFAEESFCALIKALAIDDRKPIIPEITSIKQIGSKQVKIEWKTENEDDLVGFQINKSDHPEGQYHKVNEFIISKNIREFIDSSANENNIFYNVQSINAAGNISESQVFTASIIDTTAPSKPKNLRGVIDSLGNVKIAWDWGDEYNLKGYRVLKANDSKHEFSEVSNGLIEDTSFVDKVSMNTLSPKIYYRIYSQNARAISSEFSDILALSIPDTIKPADAQIVNYKLENGFPKIEWIRSPSSDLSYQMIFRKSGKNEWKQINKANAEIDKYIDSSATEINQYCYKITSADSSNNSSLGSNIVCVDKKTDNSEISLPEIKISKSSDAKSALISLKFTREAYSENAQLKIFRSEINSIESMKLYDNVNMKSEYIDKNIENGAEYYYSIQIIDSGKKSKLSDPIKLK